MSVGCYYRQILKEKVKQRGGLKPRQSLQESSDTMLQVTLVGEGIQGTRLSEVPDAVM